MSLEEDWDNFRNSMSIDKMRNILSRMDQAYSQKSTGTWRQRWIPGVCKHENVRCTHGDEIIHRRFRRIVCVICGRSLEGPLPEVCFFTNEVHVFYRDEERGVV